MSDTDIATAPESETAPALSFLGADMTREFVRYILAAALALAVDTGFLTLFTSFFGIDYLISGAVSFSLGLLIIYILSVRWVFERRTVHNARAEFLIFAAVGIVGLGLNELILWALTSGLGLFYLFSKFASVATVFLWNFGARKYLLFRNSGSA